MWSENQKRESSKEKLNFIGKDAVTDRFCQLVILMQGIWKQPVLQWENLEFLNNDKILKYHFSKM